MLPLHWCATKVESYRIMAIIVSVGLMRLFVMDLGLLVLNASVAAQILIN